MGKIDKSKKSYWEKRYKKATTAKQKAAVDKALSDYLKEQKEKKGKDKSFNKNLGELDKL